MIRSLRLEFYPRDFWVGVYVGDVTTRWDGTVPRWERWRRIYVCPLPMILLSFDLHLAA